MFSLSVHPEAMQMTGLWPRVGPTGHAMGACCYGCTHHLALCWPTAWASALLFCFSRGTNTKELYFFTSPPSKELHAYADTHWYQSEDSGELHNLSQP